MRTAAGVSGVSAQVLPTVLGALIVLKAVLPPSHDARTSALSSWHLRSLPASTAFTSWRAAVTWPCCSSALLQASASCMASTAGTSANCEAAGNTAAMDFVRCAKRACASGVTWHCLLTVRTACASWSTAALSLGQYACSRPSHPVCAFGAAWHALQRLKFYRLAVGHCCRQLGCPSCTGQHCTLPFCSAHACTGAHTCCLRLCTASSSSATCCL
jgi:hypothetical protein